jgi:hypothetical protein
MEVLSVLSSTPESLLDTLKLVGVLGKCACSRSSSSYSCYSSSSSSVDTPRQCSKRCHYHLQRSISMS